MLYLQRGKPDGLVRQGHQQHVNHDRHQDAHRNLLSHTAKTAGDDSILTREAGVYISKTLLKNLYIPRSGKVGVFTNIHFKVTKKILESRICCNISINFLFTMIWSFMLLLDAKKILSKS